VVRGGKGNPRPRHTLRAWGTRRSDISDQEVERKVVSYQLSVFSTERKRHRSDRVMVKGGVENAEVRREEALKLEVQEFKSAKVKEFKSLRVQKLKGLRG
jgi:hypothetical protein